jgi:N-carbamoylputrescine amidase
MTNGKARTVRVAAVQMESKNGTIEANLEHATPLVNRAVEKGAKLILLPEFMPTGYIFSRVIWDNGEPKEGLTVNWLRENSKRLGVWLGTSFLEAEGEDFFNTFVLTNPDGNEAGRVRKQTPAALEAYLFKGDTGPHLIETELGKVGVGICYENQLSYLPQMMQKQSADMILMPHSAPTPMQGFPYGQKQTEYYNNQLKELSHRYARIVGVPVVMVNKCGTWQSPLPLPWAIGGKQKSSFPGLSAIVDSDGTVKAQLGTEEAVIVADVTLDPSRKIHEPPKCYGRWAFEEPWLMRNLFPVLEVCGRLSYSLSSERKKRARQISSSKK